METRTTSFEVPSTLWSEERERLLAARVDQLGLKIEGTRLEPLVDQLYAELEHAGIDVKPPVFLSDEWGCPEGVPAIGVPFYLVDERLSRLEKEVMETIEAESDREIIAYLRHEAGHAFNYAYKLFDRAHRGDRDGTRPQVAHSFSMALRRVARLTGLRRCSSKPASRAFSFSPSSL
jgi:hypothetical protein